MNHRRLTITILVLLGFSPVTAQDLGIFHDVVEGDRVGIREPTGAATGQWITQNVDPCTVFPNTAGCLGPVDNHYWRLFDLDEDHGMSGAFCTADIDYAIESALGDELALTARVWCLEDGLPFVLDNLELAAVATQELPPTVELEFFNIPITGCCDAASQSMAVELITSDCFEVSCVEMWMGSNDLGQTDPTYISAPDCGVLDPIDIELLGFDTHILMVVHGEDEGGNGGGNGDPCDPDGPKVPATSRVGSMLLVLTLLLMSRKVFRRFQISD